ncbi:tyrosine-type recombinase/integrase [Streptomyces sp. NPDC005551]|uniref:tyrosine-type recombinase/integrase n=1 Tax=Streptomyces sp. NPDC005551 TaxID=3364725 RepID=UPI0036AD8A25
MTAQVIDLFSRRPQGPVLSAVPQPAAFEPVYSADELVDAYLRTVSSKSRADYTRDMRQYRQFLQTDSGLGLDVYEARMPHVADWKTYMLDTLESAPRTVRRRMSSVGSMYQLAMAQGWYNQNPFYGVKKPSEGSVSQYTGLSLTDVEALSAHVRYACDLRTKAVIFTLLTTGLRVSELCNARREGLQARDGRWWLSVVRKGGKDDEVEIPRTAAGYLLEEVGMRDRGPLLLGARGGALARSVVWRIVRSVGDQALPHLAGRLHPHDTRHTFVSGVLLISGDIKEAQWRASHADVNNTMRYAHKLKQLKSRTADELERVFGICA